MWKKLSILLITVLAMGTAAYADDAAIMATDVPQPQLAEQREVEPATTSKACNAEAPLFQPVFAASVGDGGGTRGNCTATCYNGSTVSCSASECVARDASCPSYRGFVRCNGSTTWCPQCPPSYCPNNGCNYTFYFGSGCCVSSICPTICQ